MHMLSLVIDILLAGYVIWEVVRFGSQYRQLKQDIANGDREARVRVYQKAIVFEWVSALLAFLALGFDWSKLNPKFLALDGTRLIQFWQGSSLDRSGFDRGRMAGILLGLVLGTAGFVIARIRANRRGVTPAMAPARWWRKLWPDFSALLPATTQERLLWVAVAVSAGICEEIVFRGWLLSTLHGTLHLNGTPLVLVAAVLFGLAHSYQGATGVVLTALAGALFCGLYVVTGSLLVPILLHILIDARFAIMPAPRTQNPRAIYA
jgi:membrane protease YdiL (CAAX protease family)